MKNCAVLLVNLGSPDSFSVADVKKYLTEFLMDKYVVNLPWLLRAVMVRCFILPFRSKKSSKAYQSIWHANGSPLKVISKMVKNDLQATTSTRVFMAMRYQSPSIESQIKKICNIKTIDEVLVVPMYPHYAISTVETCKNEIDTVFKKLKLNYKLRYLPLYYNNEQYINCLVKVAKPWLKVPYDHLLFSYHGLPISHIKTGLGKGHCLKSNCCDISSLAHKTCYKHQVMVTTKLFAKKANLKFGSYSVAFQSRLGKAQWLGPYTNEVLINLAIKGMKHVLVICPAFTVDCLETLEEIAIQGNEIFQKAGGKKVTLIPCLNNNDVWIKTLKNWIEN